MVSSSGLPRKAPTRKRKEVDWVPVFSVLVRLLKGAGNEYALRIRAAKLLETLVNHRYWDGDVPRPRISCFRVLVFSVIAVISSLAVLPAVKSFLRMLTDWTKSRKIERRQCMPL